MLRCILSSRALVCLVDVDVSQSACVLHGVTEVGIQ